MSRKITELDSLTQAQANDDTRLMALGDASTGRLYKITLAQAKTIFSTFVAKHTATGSEGTTLTIVALAGKDIISITREGGPLIEVDSSPDPAEFTWNGTNIVLGTATTAGERFLIQYKST